MMTEGRHRRVRETGINLIGLWMGEYRLVHILGIP